MNKRFFVVLSVLVIASMALAACGGGGGGASSTLKIVSSLPMTGSSLTQTQTIVNAMQLRLEQVEYKACGGKYTIEYEAWDDASAALGQWDPAIETENANKAAADASIIAYLGTFNSGAAKLSIPILNQAGPLTMISPANTNPALTKGPDGKRLFDTYFRTCTTDAVQGPFAAQYLLGAGIKSVATIHDKKTYGQGLVDAFTVEFKKGGGTVVAAETIGENDKDFSAVISKIKPNSPAAIYYGGEYPQAGPLSQQMKSQGLSVPLMGGDGIYDPKYVELAGATANGDLSTSVGAPTESTEAGRKFLDQYKAAGFAEPAAAYGGYAYDAAKAIIEAAKTALKDAKDVKSARAAELTALGKVSFDGVTGKVAFDEFGDTTSKILTVYKVDGGKWIASKTDTFK